MKTTLSMQCGAPYIPMPKGRGFTANSDKLDKREAVVDFLKSMQDKPKSSYTTFGQVLPGMMYFVSKCEARAAHRTRAKLEKAYQNHPAFGRFMKGKSQTPIQEMIANAGLSNF